jgi:hypothetical protein
MLKIDWKYEKFFLKLNKKDILLLEMSLFLFLFF